MQANGKNQHVDTFQTLLNQILSEPSSNGLLKAHNDNNFASSFSTNENNKNVSSSSNSQQQQHQPQNIQKNPITITTTPSSPSLLNKQYHSNQSSNGVALSSYHSSSQRDPATPVNDLTQIKYLKNNYNIQYYPSDFISFTQQSQDNQANANNNNSSNNNNINTNTNQSSASSISPSQIRPNESKISNTKLSDFIMNNNVNTTKKNSVSSSSSTTSSSSSSSSSSSNNLKQTANQDAGGGTDPNGFMSKKTSPSPQKSTSTSTSNQSGETNLKNVKSLTNLYESKFTYQQPSQVLRQISTPKSNASNTHIDFSSIFSAKINPTNQVWTLFS